MIPWRSDLIERLRRITFFVLALQAHHPRRAGPAFA